MRSSQPFHLFFNSLAVFVTLVAFANGQCYFPGGAWASNQFPCDKNAYTTLCCPTGWTCFSNKLCIATDPSIVSSSLPLGTAIRGTCTNPEWDDSACGSFCLNDPVLSNNGSVVPCSDNKWCCQPASAGGTCNCDTGAGTFQLADGTAQTVIGVVGLGHTSTGSILSLSASSNAASSSAASTSQSTLTASKLSSTSSRGSASSTSTQSISMTSTQSGTAANQTTNSSSTPIASSTGFKAGISVIAVVFVAIIGFLLFWFFIRRPNGRRAQVPPQNQQDLYNWTPANVHPPSMPQPSPYEMQQSRNISGMELGDEMRGSWNNMPWSDSREDPYNNTAYIDRTR